MGYHPEEPIDAHTQNVIFAVGGLFMLMTVAAVIKFQDHSAPELCEVSAPRRRRDVGSVIARAQALTGPLPLPMFSRGGGRASPVTTGPASGKTFFDLEARAAVQRSGCAKDKWP